MDIIMKKGITELLLRPLRGLKIIVEVWHRASPDVKISKAYSLFTFYSDT
jgi:hypothetical protein